MRNGKIINSWKRMLPMSIGFIIVGVVITVVDRLSSGLFLAGLGPGFVVGGIVVLVVALFSWRQDRHITRDRYPRRR